MLWANWTPSLALFLHIIFIIFYLFIFSVSAFALILELTCMAYNEMCAWTQSFERALISAYQVDVNKAWISFSSIVVAFSFIFGSTIQQMFAAVVFLFVSAFCTQLQSVRACAICKECNSHSSSDSPLMQVVHPFDVGDGVLIGTDMHYVRLAPTVLCHQVSC